MWFVLLIVVLKDMYLFLFIWIKEKEETIDAFEESNKIEKSEIFSIDELICYTFKELADVLGLYFQCLEAFYDDSQEGVLQKEFLAFDVHL